MSPEQISRPMELDHRSEIYRFGCLLCEMLTGVIPFNHISGTGGDIDFALKTAICRRRPLRTGPGGSDECCLRPDGTPGEEVPGLALAGRASCRVVHGGATLDSYSGTCFTRSRIRRRGIKISSEPDGDLLQVDEALTEMQELNPEAAPVVELRFFGGSTDQEATNIIGIDIAKVRRDWVGEGVNRPLGEGEERCRVERLTIVRC